MALLRDQAWGGVAGIIAVITFCGILLQTPRFAPARQGIAASISGTTPSPVVMTVTPSVVLPPTQPPVVPYTVDATLTPNWRFACNGCDQPFLVTVTQVTVNVAAQNMIWTLSLYNHTATTVQAEGFDAIQLTDPQGDNYNASGAATQGNFSAYVDAGQTTQVQATFAFLPKHGGVYTLTATLYYADYTNTFSQYGPQTITFP